MLTLLLALSASAAEPVDYTEAWRAYLAEQRTEHIDNLTAYAEAGRYPLNLEAPGLVHMFMDDTGSRCAMAELIWESGHEGLVIETYTTRNDAVIAELSADDPLVEWVATSGLTMAEVAFIQRPGFRVNRPILDEEPAIATPSPELLELEIDRRSATFAMAALQLTMTEATSLDQAVAALGDRVHSPPPSRPTPVAPVARR